MMAAIKKYTKMIIRTMIAGNNYQCQVPVHELFTLHVISTVPLPTISQLRRSRVGTAA